MSYVFEEVGDNRELWDDICFRDWVFDKLVFIDIRHWCADKERDIYLYPIGNFRGEEPYFYDLSYKHRIIRMEVDERVEKTGDTAHPKADLSFSVDKISIPNSVWDEAPEILREIEESIYRHGVSRINVGKVSVSINCEPERVETDYNGR